MKKRIISCLVFSVLFVFNKAPAWGSLVGALECQYANNQLSYCIKGSYWFTNRFALSGSYRLFDHSFSAAFVYKVSPFLKGTTAYIGLGVRDLNDSYHSGLTTVQKIELTFGTAYNLAKYIPGLSVSLDARLIPDELFNSRHSTPGFSPIIGISVGYRLPGRQSPGTDVPEPPSDSDLDLLARLITAEAGNEPYEGQVAVGAVVLNRTRSGEFPTTIREVIYQPGQFSSLPKLSSITPVASCIKAAQDALNGVDPSRGALYFYNPATSSPEGLRFFATANLRVTVRIGNHVFLK